MFFVYYSRKETDGVPELNQESILGALNPYVAPDKWGCFSKGNTFMIQSTNWNTSSSFSEPTPYYDRESNLVVVSWARLDNKKELSKGLDIEMPKDGNAICESEYIARSYQKWGENCATRLIGDFAFVVFDKNSKKIFCARDHMGIRPFYYHLSDSSFICATNIGALTRSKHVPETVNDQWISEYLVQLSTCFEHTAYSGIKKLLPGHCLSLSPEKHQFRQYFDICETTPLVLKDSREYVDAYREELERAIRCRLDSSYPLGAELSGGIDSSTITAFAAKNLGEGIKDFHTFSYAFEVMEPQYILSVSQKCKIPLTHVVSSGKLQDLSDVDRALNITGQPVQNGAAVGHEMTNELAQKLGVRTMLSGFGGDQFSTTIFGDIILRELIMNDKYGELMQKVPGSLIMRMLRVMRLLQRKIRTRGFTVSEPSLFNEEITQELWANTIVASDKMEKYDLKKRYFSHANFYTGYSDFRKFTLEQAWCPTTLGRVEESMLMAGARKIEYRWPFLDVRLIKLFLSIPSGEHIHRGVWRHLHRKAIDGIVPDMVAWKQGKSMGGRFNKSVYSTIELDSLQDFLENPHPDLLPFINADKFNSQIEYARENNGRIPKIKKMQTNKNKRTVSMLSRWMWRNTRKQS